MSKPKALVERIIGKTGRLHDFLFQLYSVHIGTNYLSKAAVLNKKAVSWLSGNTNNFFLWIHYMDVHEPYLPPSRYASPLKSYRMVELWSKARNSPGSLSPQEVNKLIDLYDDNLGYVDKEISSLLRTLRQSNTLNDISEQQSNIEDVIDYKLSTELKAGIEVVNGILKFENADIAHKVFETLDKESDEYVRNVYLSCAS